MPNEYDAASAKPRPRDTGRRAAEPRRLRRRAPVRPLPAWPTMIDETIGSIGSTHGVSESSRPAMKNAPTIGQNEPPRSTASIARSPSAAGGGVAPRSPPATPARAPEAPHPRRLDARTCRVPPKPVRPTAARALHRRIAQARVGAALAGDDEAELGAGLLDRHGDREHVAIGLDVLLEGLVELDLAGRETGAPSVAPSAANLNCSR